MKNLLLAASACALMAGAASAEDVKLGILIGFTGPIESLTPAMAAASEMAMKEATDSGKFLDGGTPCVRLDLRVYNQAGEPRLTGTAVVALPGPRCA